MDPIPYEGTLEAARTRLLTLLADEPRVRVVGTRQHYVHAVFTTRWLRFRDDVEFSFDVDERVIHFRSASRVGRSDFGANRKRMEHISQSFLVRQSP